MVGGQPQGLNPGYKASIVLFWLLLLTAFLWGTTLLLSRCRWLGPVHTAFVAAPANVRRNIPVYIMHIVLDTIILCLWFEPVFAGWCGCTEAAPSHAWALGFFMLYIVSAYALELVWRARIDAMLALHHVATILIISVLLGELPARLYQVGDAIVLLGVFAVLEQPTFVALLLQRLLPAGSIHSVRAWKVAVGFWLASKTASLGMAIGFIVRDWALMPPWVRGLYIGIWGLVYGIQCWSGCIQWSIMRSVISKHQKQQQLLILQQLLPKVDGKAGSASGCDPRAGCGVVCVRSAASSSSGSNISSEQGSRRIQHKGV